MHSFDSRYELILKSLEGKLTRAERQQVCECLREDSEARAYLRELAEQAVTVADLGRESAAFLGLEQDATEMMAASDRPVPSTRRGPLVAKVVLPLAALVALWFVLSQMSLLPSRDRDLVTITGMTGSLQWTGGGGQVVKDLNLGERLPGGTIEGLDPFAWIELTFEDRSKMSISGYSVLTFSELGRKELYLRSGSVSLTVEPQPRGKAMTIQTSSATIKVLGTALEVEGERASTRVDVRKGHVQVKRLSDGKAVEVTANHRVIAAADIALNPIPVPEALDHWSSRLWLGPAHTLGRWRPGVNGGAPALGAVPYQASNGMTVYTTAFGVSSSQGSPVLLQPGARLRIHGKLFDASPLFVGVTVRRRDGVFAGKFQTILKAEDMVVGEAFEVMVHPDRFHLDPSLEKMRDALPPSPVNLVVEAVWCHSLNNPAGLEVYEAGIFAPDEDD